MTVKDCSVSASQLLSECADEILPAEFDQEDELLVKPPVALQSVARALTRNWDFLDRAQINPLNSDDDHYLNQLSEFPQEPETDAFEIEARILREIWQLIASRTQRRLEELREARELLDQEIRMLKLDDSHDAFWR